VDGITGAVLCAAAGYTITTGKYVSGSSDDLKIGIIFQLALPQPRLVELKEGVILFQQDL
jgi:hypothetical protein